MKIILGSQSAGRRKVLTEMGYDFEVMSADIDEKAIRNSDPIKLTLTLAQAKAQALLPKISKPALLITSDQVGLCHGEIYEKPANAEEARRFFHSYHQYPAETVTAVVVTNTATGQSVCGTDLAKVWFHPIPEEIINQAIAEGRIFDWSGGFSIDDPTLKPFIAKIEGEAESIIGLPRKLTQDLLEQIKNKTC